MSETTIIIADIQQLYRDGLKLLLKDKKGIRIVSEVDNKEKLFQALQHHCPDIVITDPFDLKEFSCQDVKQMQQISPQSKIMIISSDHDKSKVCKLLEFGIHGFLTKDCKKEEILNAIHSIAKGEKIFSNKIIEAIIQLNFNYNNYTTESEILSERELEITSLIGKGVSANEIAEKLFISVHTVRTHRKNILKKLRLNSTPELVLYAVKNNLA